MAGKGVLIQKVVVQYTVLCHFFQEVSLTSSRFWKLNGYPGTHCREIILEISSPLPVSKQGQVATPKHRKNSEMKNPQVAIHFFTSTYLVGGFIQPI